MIIQLLKRTFVFLWIAIEPLLKTNWPYMYSCASGLYSIPLIFVSVICQNLTVLIIIAQWFSTWDNCVSPHPPGYLAMSGDKFGCHNWWVVSCNAQNRLPQQRIISSKMLIAPRLRYSVKLYSKSVLEWDTVLEWDSVTLTKAVSLEEWREYYEHRFLWG